MDYADDDRIDDVLYTLTEHVRYIAKKGESHTYHLTTEADILCDKHQLVKEYIGEEDSKNPLRLCIGINDDRGYSSLLPYLHLYTQTNIL